MTTRTALALCFAMLCSSCGAPPPPQPSGVTPKAKAAATSSVRVFPSAEPAPQPSSPPIPVAQGPAWRVLASLPTSFAVDGKVDEWQSQGAVQKGWMVVLKDRVVIAGAAPAGASNIEVSLSFGPHEQPRPHQLREGGTIDPRGCAGDDLLCKNGFAEQEKAIEPLFDATQSTYVIQGAKVTINGKDAALSKAAASSGSAAWFELEIPLAELPAMPSTKLRSARVQVRAGGDTQATSFDDLEWKNEVRVGGETGILAEAVLSAVEEDNETLLAIVDWSGKEPTLRAASINPLGDYQPAVILQGPLSAMKVAAKAGDLEMLRYDAITAQGVATRKNGTIIDAWALPGNQVNLRRPVVREDVIDIGYDRTSPLDGVPMGIDDVLVAVARAEASGRIVPIFVGESFALATGSKPFVDNNLSRLGVRGKRWTGSGFASLSFLWRYDPKSRQYEEVEGKLE